MPPYDVCHAHESAFTLHVHEVLVARNPAGWPGVYYCDVPTAGGRAAMAKREAQVKTNGMRALDARHIPYTTFTYPSTIHSADEVAALLGVPAGEVFKTLVMVTDGGRHLLLMAPGDGEVDLRLLARALGVKSVRMVAQREAERLTGLLVGGISPLALLGRPFEVYLDARAQPLERLYVNGGQRGVNVCLRVTDLLAVTGARFVEATHSAAAD